MRDWDPKYIIALGFVLVMVGFLLPLMMVLRWIPSTFFLNFLAYASSFTGVMFGMIGGAFFIIKSRNKRH